MNTTLTLPGITPAVSTKYDLAVFIGRMQILHEGHRSVINLAFENARNVLLLVGSANAPRSHRNPFTYGERVSMARDTFPEQSASLFTRPLEDVAYNDTQWVLNAQKAVEDCLDEVADREGLSVAERRKMRVCLVGCNKDSTGYFLSLFPTYASVSAPNHKSMSSTPMREAYFSNIVEMWLKNCDGHRVGDKPVEHVVPTPVRTFLIDFATSKAYRDILAEYEFIAAYKARWASAPFPVTMVTTDAVVIQSGHILLVRRRGMPGLGTWALPGGYLQQDEQIVDGMIRELVEETRIGVDPDDLKKCITASRVFDEPNRDPRGRVITHGFRIDLPPRKRLPNITKKKVKLAPVEFEQVEGSDDADLAKWFPLSEVKREIMFSDHIDIIRALADIN